jgi:transcriptional regulator with XRE-family HTH domain
MMTHVMNTKRKPTSRPAFDSLREWRHAQGFDQGTAARFLEISRAYYCKLEHAVAAPRPTIAKRVTERTGVPLEVLLGIAA